MKKKHVRLIIWSSLFIALVLGTNLTIVGYFLKRNYTYSNYNGSFRHYEDRLKGKSYEGRDNRYGTFLERNPNIKDKQLYRTFTLDPWRFWEWREWYYHFDRFTLPYISEKEIQRNRALEGLDNEQRKDSLP
ncbi:hypothetical protein [Parapedobacter koreensis]|uniref:Uncharacterized protein n=1 Tax=Parapedobacter koreensis TaxID=332977 RepID=A0A1H7J685_9SPHI|nr:hypothetical protein [Parapedobacter koreensis]SEK69500.1 hypothetical protein SAMN05421740_102453 [Parapedobacter koreensis]